MIRTKGGKLWFLPPDPPDLNPIEQAISKIKQAMRIAGERTAEAFTNSLAAVIASIP